MQGTVHLEKRAPSSASKKINMKKIKLVSLLLFSITMVLTACKEGKKLPQAEETNTGYSTSVDFDRTLMQILDQSPEYNSFLKLVNSVSLFDELKELNNVMIFVPSDEAYGPSKYKINELSVPDSLSRLKEILNYHIVKSESSVENLIASIEMQETPLRLETAHGGYLVFRMEKNELQILDENGNVAMVKRKSTRGSNGIVYTINKLLVPRKELGIEPANLQGK